MGRYYSGDIEGKFMFAVQSSMAADRFGSEYCEPNYVEYYFDTDNLETINSELEKLKPGYDLVSKFFEKRRNEGIMSYTDADAEKEGITGEMMSDFADYNLGKKIKDCVEEQGSCSFTAEL
jgi:hypothetical protein